MLLLEDDVVLFRLKGFLCRFTLWFSDEVVAEAAALALALGVELRGVPPDCSRIEKQKRKKLRYSFKQALSEDSEVTCKSKKHESRV